MAYNTSLLSVPEENVAAFRARCSKPWILRIGKNRSDLASSRKEVCSHAIAYWVEVQPLGELLGEAIDGGELLHPALRHPFRPPLYQRPQEVRVLHARLEQAWYTASQQGPDDSTQEDWYNDQISRVLALFAWASHRGEGVVTLLFW